MTAGFFITSVSLVLALVLKQKEEHAMYVFCLIVEALTLFLGLLLITKKFAHIVGDGAELTLMDILLIILHVSILAAPPLGILQLQIRLNIFRENKVAQSCESLTEAEEKINLSVLSV